MGAAGGLLGKVQGASIIMYLGTTAAAGMYLYFLPLTLLVRPISPTLFHKLTSRLVAAWWVSCVFLTEQLNGVRVRITGEVRVGITQVGFFRAVAKKPLRLIPVFGWVFKLIGFLFLSRSWEADQSRISKWAQALARNRRPIWLVLYPEGTRYTEKGKALSDQAAAKMGEEPIKGELMLPRTKGFALLARCIRPHFHSIVDMTIGYTGHDGKPLTWRELGTDALIGTVTGDLTLARVHIHLRLYPCALLPDDDAKLKLWVMERWREKEGLLLHLAKDGVFPAAANAALETPPPLMMAQLAFAIFFVATTVGLGWLLALFQWARLYVLGSTLAVVVIAYLDI